MYLFTRSARLAPGNTVQSQAWALSITEKVNQVTELNVSLWSRVFSPGFGTLSWTSIVEDLAELEDSDAKLMVDNGFISLVDEGARFLAEGVEDGLAQIVGPITAPVPDAPQPNYANVVRAVITPGNTMRAMELGVEIAEKAGKVTGLDTVFVASLTGAYGEVEWIAACETIQQLQKGQQALATDEQLIKLIEAEASKVFQPSAEQLVYRRVI
jgi:hypothetical protein